MDEYISRSKLLDKFNLECSTAEQQYVALIKAPAADVVEVVRCRHGKFHHWEQEPCHGKTEHFCSVLKAQVFADFYCYHGKPKE